MSDTPLIVLNQLTRAFTAGGSVIHALRPTDLSINRGDFVTIMGPSGSGKSTLLNIFGLLTPPTSGVYTLSGQVVSSLSDSQTSHARGRLMGMVFQSFNLLPHLTIMENVCVPMQYAHVPTKQMHLRAKALLDQVGLQGRYHSRPSQLSGGQCQRVAIARALANDPPLILADEPTGNLDEKTGNEVIGIFQALSRNGKTVIMVTHNPCYEQYATRALWIHDGNVTEPKR